MYSFIARMTENSEKSFNVGIFGENLDRNRIIGQAFGAPGTRSDIQFYNRLDDTLGYIFCAITPIDYPEKIKSLLQTLMMTDIYVLVVDLTTGLNSIVGEILVAMDQFNQVYHKKSIVCLDNIKNNEWKIPVISKKLRNILDTTSLNQTGTITIENREDLEILKKKVIELGLEFLIEQKSKTNHSYTKILIDHVFPVKGIGTVALALIKGGSLKKGQMLEIVGYNGSAKKVLIKNIQKQDKNFNIASINDRVGLALKGIKPTEINRENILASPDIFKRERDIEADIYINEYYKPKKGKIIPGEEKQYHGLVDLRLSPIKFLEGNAIKPGNNGTVKMHFNKPLFHDGSGLQGILVELNKFQSKNRIVGYFTQK
jgi:selenocysteine-specific translation elongation factor